MTSPGRFHTCCRKEGQAGLSQLLSLTAEFSNDLWQCPFAGCQQQAASASGKQEHEEIGTKGGLGVLDSMLGPTFCPDA